MYFDYVIAEIHSIMRLFVNYNDVIMSAVVPQITSLTIVYSTAYSAADQRKHQSSESLAFVRGIHRWPVNSPHKGPIIWKCSHLMTSSTKTMITALYLQATWSKNYISLVHEISFINLKYLFLLLRLRKSERHHDAEDRSFQLHDTCYISVKKCWNLFALVQ